MKQNFFYDEGDNKPYESIQDWYKDIKHLIIPTIILVVLGIAAYIYFNGFHFWLFNEFKNGTGEHSAID